MYPPRLPIGLHAAHHAPRAWKISGHEGYYSENMYPPMELDDADTG